MTPLCACKIVVHLGMWAKNIDEHDTDADLLEFAGYIAGYQCAVGPNLSEETVRRGSQEGQEVRPMKRLAPFNVDIDYAQFRDFIEKPPHCSLFSSAAAFSGEHLHSNVGRRGCRSQCSKSKA